MRKENSNKGFSLVELIIVIAIMLVLVGILAPQFVKYVHRARVAADVASAQELAKAIQVMLADEENIDEATYIGNGISYFEGLPIAGSIGDEGVKVYSIGSKYNGVAAGTTISNLDGITQIPVSQINRDCKWIVQYTEDGNIFIALSGPGRNKYILYPEYNDNFRWYSDVWTEN